MIWVNHCKDTPETWSSFPNREQAEEYMSNRGGSYAIQQGPQLKQEWINIERNMRELDGWCQDRMGEK